MSTANREFKLSYRKYFDIGLSIALGVHILSLVFMPRYIPNPFRLKDEAIEVIDVVHEIEIPPPPKEIPRPQVPVAAEPDEEVEEEETIEETVLDIDDLPPAPPPPPSEVKIYSFYEEPPVPVYNPPPEYPDLARRAEIEGTVMLRCVLSETGDIIDAQVIKSVTQALDEAALRAVRQWKYQPAKNNNIPVRVYLVVPVAFRLRG
jgi:protein TonB